MEGGRGADPLSQCGYKGDVTLALLPPLHPSTLHSSPLLTLHFFPRLSTFHSTSLILCHSSTPHNSPLSVVPSFHLSTASFHSPFLILHFFSRLSTFHSTSLFLRHSSTLHSIPLSVIPSFHFSPSISPFCHVSPLSTPPLSSSAILPLSTYFLSIDPTLFPPYRSLHPFHSSTFLFAPHPRYPHLFTLSLIFTSTSSISLPLSPFILLYIHYTSHLPSLHLIHFPFHTIHFLFTVSLILTSTLFITLK